MTTIAVNGAKIAYDEAGSGPAVLLVHGAGADRRLWNHQFDALRRTHRVIRYDWRGYGESGDALGDYAHAEDLLGVMDALGVERATLVGSSMGGSRAVEAALTAPGRVEALVLISSGLAGHVWPERMLAQAREMVHSSIAPDRLAAYRTKSAPPTAEDVEAFAAAHVLWQVAGPSRTRADLSEQVWRDANEMARLVFQRLWTAPAATEREVAANQRLGEITAPTLVINGLADVPDIQTVSDLLTDGIPGARRVDLPDTGHLPPLERPEEVTAALIAFAR
ncbi:alpha/beta fold hydrolase [Nonomuraea sp. NPDC050556]|uniref:alpha/beta fold hydrolase n=1 Tax=Nonomuraea sp. NPDC050556 TaxID=3364369 RepID=UPI0037944E1C